MSGIQKLLQGRCREADAAAYAFSRHGTTEIDRPKQHEDEGALTQKIVALTSKGDAAR